MATEVLASTGSSVPQRVSAGVTGVDAARPCIALGGINVDNVNLQMAVDRIRGFVLSGEAHQVVTVNLDFLSIASRDESFRETLNAADLAVADGMPLVWLSRLKGDALPERVAGVDLVNESCRMAVELDCGVFLLGAGPGVADAAAQRLRTLSPGLRVLGTYTPPFGGLDQAENERIVQKIRAAAPDFLFVALGAPQQDLWIREHQTELRVPVAMGVGCVFDLLAGSLRRAPRWMQHTGLEWAFRLGQEPQRLWRRYLLHDLPVLARVALSTSGRDPSNALALAR